MNYEEWKRVEYIKYDSRDGFGAQIAHLNGIQPFAEKCGLKIIIDFRVWPFFINNKDLVCDKQNTLSLAEDIIWKPSVIDSIDPLNILSLSKDELARVNWRPKAKGAGSYEIFIKHADREKVRHYGDKVKNSIGVHIRRGNGEFESLYSRRRSRVSLSGFFEKINEMDGGLNILLCTDEAEVRDRFAEKYGERIISVKKEFLPFGAGPGHNNELPRIGVKADFDVWQILGEAALEHELLSKARHLVHCSSNFNRYAGFVVRKNGGKTILIK